jgi:ubiquinone/menaquinone biosynthesis C-methylase UbiE
MSVVASMQSYYARRAATYERVYAKPERQNDLRAMQAWIGSQFAGRSVLELACGTGWWTPHAARDAQAWLATDINPETLALAQAKALPPCVRLATVDAYSLDGIGAQRFDAAFAGCWWSHVLLQDLPSWLAQLHARLEPGARVVFLDNSFVQTSSLPITRHDALGNTYQQRVLDDGSTHEVLKNFPSFEQALKCIGPRTQHAQWHAWTHYWALSYSVA